MSSIEAKIAAIQASLPGKRFIIRGAYYHVETVDNDEGKVLMRCVDGTWTVMLVEYLVLACLVNRTPDAGVYEA